MKDSLRLLTSRHLVNIIFFLFIVLGIVFALNFEIHSEALHEYNTSLSLKYVVLFLGIYLISHGLRFARLYILLLEEKVKGRQLLEIYFATSWVNFLLPFKIGELFRITEIGNLCGNLRKGIITVWIERFFDAIVLSSIIFSYFIFFDSNFGKFIPIAIVLIVFVAFSLLYYLEYTYSFKYLTQFLISKSNSKRGVVLLKILHNLKIIHTDIKKLVRGRASLLLFFSIAIWGVEIISIYILSLLVNISSLTQSFVVLINESLLSKAASNLELILLYKSLTFGALVILALPCVLVLAKNRIKVSLQQEKKIIHQPYMRKESLVNLEDL